MSENMKQTAYVRKALYNYPYFTELTEEDSMTFYNIGIIYTVLTAEQTKGMDS